MKGTEKLKEVRDEDFLKDKITPVLKKRLIASFCFLVPLLYLSMGHMMWNWPLPGFLSGNHVAMGLIQMLFTIVIMVINQVLYQRLQRTDPSCTEYGHAGCTWIRRIICI